MRTFLAVPALVAVISTAATALAAGQPTLTLSAATTRVLYGHPVTLSGRLKNVAAGQPVSIWARRGVGSPVRAATVTTRAGGRWAFEARPRIGTSYTAHWRSIVSRTAAVGVQPRIRGGELGDGSIRATVEAGRSFAGRSVQLQEQSGGAWTTIRRKALDKHSAAVFVALAEPARLRIAMSVNQAGVGYLGSRSRPFRYRPPAPARQAEALTMAPSSFRVLYGGIVALTGRLANGHAGERVTIQARHYGTSAPVVVGTAVTDARGNWSLRVHPAIQTTYRAVRGKRHSRRITIGVSPLITLRELSNGYIVAHVAAGRSFHNRRVKLQQLTAAGIWSTVKQKALNRASTAVFGIALPTSQVRVTMSVNQAGAGYLGSISHAMIYHAA